MSVAPNSLIRQPLAPSTVTSWSRPIVSSYSDVAKTGLTKSEANQADLTIKSSPSPVSLEKSNNPDEPVLKLLPDTLEFNTEILKVSVITWRSVIINCILNNKSVLIQRVENVCLFLV